MNREIKSYLAEFIGTAILVIGGVGTAVISGSVVGNLGVAFAFGLTLLFLVYAIGPISGCHVNPAVTIGLLVTGKINVRDAIAYIIAQVAGGIVGALIVLGIAEGRPGYIRSIKGLGQNGYGVHSPANYNLGSGFVTEVVMTFLLVFVVLAATDRIGTSALAGLAIGLTLTVIHLVSIPVTNTSVNPARSIGPALFAGNGAIGQLWLFIVAPIIGGVIGAGVYRGIWGPGVALGEPALDVPTER
ncbi:aquaporin Z [Frankineae bacterium MT45]|nr:aquaporin Z [Frankineae bacterium MT45]